jgi:hypothetical protein
MLLIGISGKKRSGKDTVYELIAKASSKRVRRYAFADALKKEVSKACGVTPEEIEQNKDRFRLILQGWGTEFRRSIDQEYWTEQLRKTLKTAHLHCDVAVVTDVRFKNEAELVKELGGKLIRVHRPGNNSADLHPSEIEMDSYEGYDWSISNDGSLGDLEKKVAILMDNLLYQTHLKEQGVAK